MFDLAVGGEQVDAIQLALVAGSHADGFFFDAVLDQLGFDDIDSRFRALGSRLTLLEGDGSDRLVGFLCNASKTRSLLQGMDDGRLPTCVLGKVNWQLNHLLRLQLVGGGRHDHAKGF